MKGRAGADQFAGVAPWLQTAWDLRAAGNFIGGGAGTGLLLMVAIAQMTGTVSPVLLCLGLLLVAAGLFSVFLEIGRPLRALNVLFGGRRSWMTREAYVALVLFPLGAAGLFWPELRPLLIVPVIPYMYCQARMLKEAKGIPAWREPRIVPLILATAVTEGAGIFVLANAVLGNGVALWAAGVLLGGLVVRAGVWAIYRRRLTAGGAPARVVPLVAAFCPRFLLAGHLLPLILVVAGLLLPAVAAPTVALAGLIAALAGWIMKVFIITKIAFNQGFAIPVTPIRGKGKPRSGTAPGWR